MIFRQYGDYQVRVDDMTLADRQLLEESHKLIGRIVSRSGDTIAYALFGWLLAVVFTAVICLVARATEYVIPAAIGEAIGGAVVLWLQRLSRRASTIVDIRQLYQIMHKSERCRAFVENCRCTNQDLMRIIRDNACAAAYNPQSDGA